MLDLEFVVGITFLVAQMVKNPAAMQEIATAKAQGNQA